jgi:Tol biopolymer transport system component
MKVLVKYLLISILCLGICTPVFSQQAEKLFLQGMMKEEAEGNLEEAIGLYNKVVNDVSAKRSVRANALMHVGICYEKLGKGNALNAYQKIISEYGDQKDIVSIARKKVQSLKGTTNTKLSKGLISERIEKNLHDDYWLYKFSPDGRYYLYENRINNTHEISICDLQTGKKDSLTTGNQAVYGRDNTLPWGPRWSPNGEKIAYNWGFWGHFERENKIREIRLIDKNGKNKQVILSGPLGEIPNLEGFTHDGKNLIGTMVIQENDQKIQQLVLISIANKNFKPLKNFGKRVARHFSYSPDGKYLLYDKAQLKSENRDIFVMSMADMKETQITNNNNSNWEPSWGPDGNQILFLSNRVGSNGLYKIAFENGKPIGNPENIKTNLGEDIGMMGISNDGSVFYATQTGRHDVFTIDLDEKFNNKVNKVTQITNPALKASGGLAKYSKDGRYISYMGNPNNNTTNKEADFNLGDKYYINIYDTKTKTSKLLNLDLYINHKSWKYLYHVPSWSYHENKLLVHGMIKENYEGGFFTVDALTEKITPVLTVPDCKQGTEYKLFGNSMVFSKTDKNKIFYSSPDWKDLMEYNMVTKEERSIIHIEDGFWFNGFMDDAETQCIALNRFGQFIADVNTKKVVKVGEKEMGWTLGSSKDKKYHYYGQYPNKLTRVRVDGSEPNQEIIFDEYFQNATSYNIMVLDLHPKRNEILLGVGTSSGTDIYKLTNVFD